MRVYKRRYSRLVDMNKKFRSIIGKLTRAAKRSDEIPEEHREALEILGVNYQIEGDNIYESSGVYAVQRLGTICIEIGEEMERLAQRENDIDALIEKLDDWYLTIKNANQTRVSSTR